MRDSHDMRVGVTLEQCWHRVPGGTARAAIETTRALAERGDLDLVGVSARHRHPPVPPWQPPIAVAQLPLPRRALYESWHRLRKPNVERATGPVDVIHATGVAMPPHTVPIVLTVHDLAYLHDPAHFTRNGLRFFHQALGIARREADLVLCSSDATRIDCVEAGFRPERLRLVPLGVRVEPADDGAVEAIRRRHGLGRYVLWVGTIEPRKNLSTLLEAFRRLDHESVDLVIVGPDGWNEDIGRHAAGLDGRLKVLGFQPREEMASLYAGAEVFCLPSLREGFGLPVLEAMAQGTPVVTSAGTSTEEVAGEAGVLVDPRDPGALAAAMAGILDDRERAAALGVAGRARAAEYTWERTAALTAAAYAEAAA